MTKLSSHKIEAQAQGWATSHVLIALAIAFAAGFILRMLFG